jgi:hypothetical protein
VPTSSDSNPLIHILRAEVACLKLGPRQCSCEKDEWDGDRNHSCDGLYGHCLTPSAPESTNYDPITAQRFDLGQTIGSAAEPFAPPRIRPAKPNGGSDPATDLALCSTFKKRSSTPHAVGRGARLP